VHLLRILGLAIQIALQTKNAAVRMALGVLERVSTAHVLATEVTQDGHVSFADVKRLEKLARRCATPAVVRSTAGL
jgi:hypothetical protein